MEEINRLKEELSSKETSNRLEQSKLTRQIQESEDDRQNLQDYIIELDRQLKVSMNMYKLIIWYLFCDLVVLHKALR